MRTGDVQTDARLVTPAPFTQIDKAHIAFPVDTGVDSVKGLLRDDWRCAYEKKQAANSCDAKSKLHVGGSFLPCCWANVRPPRCSFELLGLDDTRTCGCLILNQRAYATGVNAL
jgi:hypothetical protein